MSEHSGNKKQIAKSAASVGVAVMCSRVLGLVREQVFAGLFGAGHTTDAFVVAFRIPNLLRDLFGEGALSAAFVTVFTAYDTNRSSEDTWRLASNVFNFFLVLLSALTILAICFSDQIVNAMAPGYSATPGKIELTVWLTRIMMPFLVVISLSAVVMGVLNTKGRFFIPSLASSFFNLGSIIGGTSLALILPKYGYPAIVGMAIGTLIGGFLQLTIQLPSLFGIGFRYFLTLNLRDPGLHRILKLMVPATIGLSATQINLLVSTNFAASCAEGSVSWLQYSFRLVQLPIGVFGVAISIAMLPVLAQQAAKKQLGEMKETMVSSLTMVFALTLPATAGLILLAEPIIRLIFEHGAFTEAHTIATAHSLALYAIGLFAYSANKVLVPAFYALDKPQYPVVASFLAIAVNVAIISITIGKWQHLAIAFSMSCTMLVNFLFLMTVLYIKLSGYSVGYLAKGVGKVLVATVSLCAFIYFGLPLVSSMLHGNLAAQGVGLLVMIIGSVVVYGVVLHFLHLNELRIFTNKIRARFNR